jgi:dipeptidyl aminopeptidase/acylaminoacyl peptidase
MSTDGTNQFRVTYDTASDVDPDISPDGQEIVFSSNQTASGTANIFLRDRNGVVRNLTNNAATDEWPRWRPAIQQSRGAAGLRHGRQWTQDLLHVLTAEYRWPEPDLRHEYGWNRRSSAYRYEQERQPASRKPIRASSRFRTRRGQSHRVLTASPQSSKPRSRRPSSSAKRGSPRSSFNC